MHHPVFDTTGNSPDDYVTIDGEIDWAIIPAYTIKGQSHPLPVRLRLGDQNFGENHINLRHGKWLTKIRRDVRQMLWEKLFSHSGKFYRGNKAKKVNLYMRLSPESLITLERQVDHTTRAKHFLSVVTLYAKQPNPDDKYLGDYSSTFANPNVTKPLLKR